MIKLENLKKKYPEFFLDVSLNIPENQITALIGPNGSGKTTLFKLMLGLISRDAGNVQLLDQDIDHLDAEIKGKIGVVFNDSGFPGELKTDDLPDILKAFYPSFDDAQYKKLIRQLNVPQSQLISSLSTGQNAKLKLCAAIGHDPKLLILDEPTSGLDIIARDEILDLLRLWMETPGRSILISSHISSDLENLCDDVYFLEKGRIALHESVEEINADYGLLSIPAEQMENIDPAGFVYALKEKGIFKIIVRDRKFYQENYPEIPLDRCSLDDLLLILTKGEQL